MANFDLSPSQSIEHRGEFGQKFVEWLRSGTGIYWIQGKMGCGKSTLMKYVTGHNLTREYLLEWVNGKTLHQPSYYFSRTGTSELQNSLQGLYRTILATLLRHDRAMFRVVFPDWQVSESHCEPTSAVLREALKRFVTKSELSYKYCFFIDGLDEYHETDNGLRGELAEDILGLAKLSAVKLVVSSRPEPIFRLKFAHCLTMELHNFTRSDIAAYVDAEIRRRALPQVLTSTETDDLNSLCDEVILKAEGVFLWVTIAVASILNGIAYRETLPKLRSRLKQLDPRLKVLFKQVLTEKVHPSHRKQVARSLLTDSQCRNHSFGSLRGIGTIPQAISPQVDKSHDYRPLLVVCEIRTHVSDLQNCLPSLSCGLYVDGRQNNSRTIATMISSTKPLPRPLLLSHSSLYELLDDHETQALLLEQAGDDFQADKALAVGQMANFVYDIRSGPFFSREDYIKDHLMEIVHNIERTEISTGCSQTKLVSIFDKLQDQELASSPLSAKLLEPQWDALHEYSEYHDDLFRTNHTKLPLSRPQGDPWSSCHSSDMLSLTISFGFTCYLRYELDTRRGIPVKTGTPLLFYPLWTSNKFEYWVKQRLNMTSSIPVRPSNDKGKCHPSPVRLLLAAGADPNECCHDLTPWIIVLERLCSGFDDDFPLLRVGPPNAVNWPKKSFLDKLEIAKLMLQHGADPFFCKAVSDYEISAQIFAEFLGRECCSGYTLNDCICTYSRQVQPQLTELVELVEQRKYFKRQMWTDGELLLVEAWLVVVLAYVVHSLLEWASCCRQTRVARSYRRSMRVKRVQECFGAKGLPQ